MSAAIEEDIFVGWTVANESGEFPNGHWPERTAALFAAFAANLYRRRAQVQVTNQQLRGFVRTATGVVKKQQKGIIAATLWGLTIRGGQQCIDLGFLQVCNHGHRGLLERDRTKLTTPVNVLGTVFADETGQRMDSGESLVAGRDPTLTRLFQM
jgi:hypothetical protein